MGRTRRGRQEGSIIQKATGSWEAQFSGGYDGNGKRRRKSKSFTKKSEAVKWLKSMSPQSVTLDSSRTTVQSYLTTWLESIRGTIAPTTHKRYEQIVRLHIIPYIGKRKLTDLTLIDVEKMFAEQAEKGASDRNRELSGVVLNRAIKKASRAGLIDRNPCYGADKPKSKAKEMSVWNQEQANIFLEKAKDDRLHALFHLMLTSGARQGELLALTWDDVDFSGSAITITKTLEEIAGKLRPKEPKTAASRRRIPLPTTTMATLQAHRKEVLAAGHIAGPVFCDSKGGYLRQSNIRRRHFLKIIEGCNKTEDGSPAAVAVPVIRIDDLRHTCATLLLLKGENVKVVSERLGHARIEVTLATYAHVLPGMQEAAVSKLEELFG